MRDLKMDGKNNPENIEREEYIYPKNRSGLPRGTSRDIQVKRRGEKPTKIKHGIWAKLYPLDRRTGIAIYINHRLAQLVDQFVRKYGRPPEPSEEILLEGIPMKETQRYFAWRSKDSGSRKHALGIAAEIRRDLQVLGLLAFGEEKGLSLEEYLKRLDSDSTENQMKGDKNEQD